MQQNFDSYRIFKIILAISSTDSFDNGDNASTPRSRDLWFAFYQAFNKWANV